MPFQKWWQLDSKHAWQQNSQRDLRENWLLKKGIQIIPHIVNPGPRWEYAVNK